MPKTVLRASLKKYSHTEWRGTDRATVREVPGNDCAYLLVIGIAGRDVVLNLVVGLMHNNTDIS